MGECAKGYLESLAYVMFTHTYVFVRARLTHKPSEPVTCVTRYISASTKYECVPNRGSTFCGCLISCEWSKYFLCLQTQNKVQLGKMNAKLLKPPNGVQQHLEA